MAKRPIERTFGIVTRSFHHERHTLHGEEVKERSDPDVKERGRRAKVPERKFGRLAKRSAQGNEM